MKLSVENWIKKFQEKIASDPLWREKRNTFKIYMHPYRKHFEFWWDYTTDGPWVAFDADIWKQYLSFEIKEVITRKEFRGNESRYNFKNDEEVLFFFIL